MSFRFDKAPFRLPIPRDRERMKMLIVIVFQAYALRFIMKIFLFFRLLLSVHFLKIAIKWIMIMKATKQAQIYVFVVVRLPQIFTIISKLLFAIVNEKKNARRTLSNVAFSYAKLLS